MYTVYVLHSKVYDKIYIGYTADLIDRFHSHNALATKGYTVKYRPWIVAYTEYFDTKTVALKREKQLKSARGTTYIWEFINQHFLSN